VADLDPAHGVRRRGLHRGAHASDRSDHEIDVRDSLHGAVVWGAGVLMAAFIAFLGVSGAATAASSQGDERSIVGSISRTVESTVEDAASQEP
jgi:hypothetical protein